MIPTIFPEVPGRLETSINISAANLINAAALKVRNLQPVFIFLSVCAVLCSELSRGVLAHPVFGTRKESESGANERGPRPK